MSSRETVLSRPWAFALCGMLLLAGCNYLPGSASSSTSDLEDFDDLEATIASDEPVPEAPSADSQSLSLKLKVGDRFPLMKTVEQKLTQATAEGLTHSRKLETMLSVTVEEISGARKRLGVRYHRVRYSQDIAGRRVNYSSDNVGDTVAPEAAQYAGLVDNGFSFWIGPDNEIAELVGFEEFLEQCWRDLPFDQRPVVQDSWASVRSEDGLANFIDDSIGLLPGSLDASGKPQALHIGYAWELKPRKIEGELPMQIRTKCVLKEFNEKSAEIDIIGSIPPTSVVDPASGLKLSLVNGHCHGNCHVDRATGLPTRSRVERYLDMSVELADGSVIPQRKQIVTTIDTYPDQTGGKLTEARAPRGF